ncbi:hypothetical protein Val02_34080 [Virgisporangium aliadipatigenens]|uniref:D-alanine--D-alanine ligase C-terminal domain-containing protein n=1 Tax=Virgisporangium aliadipatigenens TaxID=741659 RepID=A0A8J3YLI9_9ACTN|nr:hypothetical protein [Virgisporangium aliadipatigenens]GIJ46522.1 hypothetical protein Val02_34080 [Virgisporangium aliadipatigenens]
MPDVEHIIGLLLGTEDDWPRAFEALVKRLGPVKDGAGRTHGIETKRVTIEPFDLRDKPRHSLVIDRLAHWYYHPREWLKKVALMDDVYLLNSPFTFQSMEKHAAYCAMIRLGLKVPGTVLVPYKHPVENSRWAYTAARYNQPFDLDEVAERLGYPLFMKPYDGGAWVGVSKIDNADELHAAYDTSGERLMHLQQAVEGYDVFARSLSIGPETMVMKFRPELPMHERYAVSHNFLGAGPGMEVVTISQLVNAFFRWEFNSCECLVRGDEVYPIDYANACPDVSLTSLHYYFPWAMTALLRWSVFCVVTGRKPRLDLDTARYFEVAARDDLSYGDKLARYQALADEYFETERYQDFCASRLGMVDEMVHDWVTSPDFDELLVDTVKGTYPEAEHEMFVSHFRGLIAAWIHDRTH